MRLALFATICTLSIAPTLKAAPITTLFDTGVDASGSPLANTASDLHYTLASFVRNDADARQVSPSSAILTAYTSALGFPIMNGVWVGDDTVSRWIGPADAQGNPAGPVGIYDYRTTFSLAGLNAATASISGRWSADNIGVDIVLNGKSTGQTAGGFQSFYDFNLASGFVPGINTIDFVVSNAYPDPTNSPNYTGLRVEMSGVAAVPEPASVPLLLAGLTMITLARRRR